MYDPDPTRIQRSAREINRRERQKIKDCIQADTFPVLQKLGSLDSMIPKTSRYFALGGSARSLICTLHERDIATEIELDFDIVRGYIPELRVSVVVEYPKVSMEIAFCFRFSAPNGTQKEVSGELPLQCFRSTTLEETMHLWRQHR